MTYCADIVWLNHYISLLKFVFFNVVLVIIFTVIPMSFYCVFWSYTGVWYVVNVFMFYLTVSESDIIKLFNQSTICIQMDASTYPMYMVITGDPFIWTHMKLLFIVLQTIITMNAFIALLVKWDFWHVTTQQFSKYLCLLKSQMCWNSLIFVGH